MPAIDLFAGLRKFERTSKKTGKVSVSYGIEIANKGEQFIDPTNRAALGIVANAITTQLRDALTRGQLPDGTPLPPVTAVTEERRVDEEAQGRNGGKPVVKVGNPEYADRAVDNFKRDYKPGRLKGGPFVPKAGGPRGNVSGLLAKSPYVHPSADGKSFLVKVAAIRGRPRPGDSVSAVESVFGNLLNSGLVNRMLRQPMIRRAAERAQKAMIANSIKDLFGSFAKLLREGQQLGNSFSAFGQDPSE